MRFGSDGRGMAYVSWRFIELRRGVRDMACEEIRLTAMTTAAG